MPDNGRLEYDIKLTCGWNVPETMTVEYVTHTQHEIVRINTVDLGGGSDGILRTHVVVCGCKPVSWLI